MIEENQEGIRTRDFEVSMGGRGGGGGWSNVGKSNVAGAIDGSRLAKLILRD